MMEMDGEGAAMTGGLDPRLLEKYQCQAVMLANRVKKRHGHLRKRFASRNIEVFRLYDWEIPEIRAVVDWYAGHLVIGEYTREQSTAQWLPMMAGAVAEALGVGPEKVHLKKRVAGLRDGKRYERTSFTDKMIMVAERDLKFYVNPYDFVDTGLFSDHRETRRMIRESARGKDFLNLFCYSGTFTCCAAAGGARSTLSVDRSRTAIEWARRNMQLNEIPAQRNTLIQSDVSAFLSQAGGSRPRAFDLAVVDPPSFSSSRGKAQAFDVAADHPGLLNAVAALMRKGGIIFFSTNHQDFTSRMREVNAAEILEITAQTIPEDYLNPRKLVHRCWRIIV